MKNSKRFLWLFIAMVLSIPVFAQTGVQGVVLSKDKQPLMGAVVSIPEQNIQVSTDSEGVFRINNVQPGKTKLVVTSIGCVEYTKNVTILADSVINVGTLKMKNASKGGRVYRRFSAAYNYSNVDVKLKYEGFDATNVANEDLLHYEIQVIIGYYLTKEKSWSIESGFAFRFYPFDDSDIGYTYDVDDRIGIQIPVHVGYRHNFSRHFSLRPYAGVYARYELVLEKRWEDSYSDEYSEYITSVPSDERFGVGMVAGVAMKFRKFYLSLSYEHDVFKKTIIKSNKMPTITFGIEF